MSKSFEKWWNNTLTGLSRLRSIENRDAKTLANVKLVAKGAWDASSAEVDWHKNTPESQPESGRDIWVSEPHAYGVDLYANYRTDLYCQREYVTHWAYAILPELPEQVK